MNCQLIVGTCVQRSLTFQMSHLSTVRNSAHIGRWGPLVLVFFEVLLCFGVGLCRFSGFRFAPLTNMQSFHHSHDDLGTPPGVHTRAKKK